MLSYHLEVDQAGGGTGPWTEVAGEGTDSLLLVHTVPGLTEGLMHYFRYRVRNVHGWSEEYSPTQAVLLATVPVATAVARTSNSATDVVIDWDAPTFDGNAALLGYRVKIRDSSGLFQEETASCDGSGAGQATILSTRTCTIPMTSLTDASTFGLAEDDLIVAVVESLNTIGYSPTSPENTAGALVQVVPGAPPTAPTRGAATSDSQLVVEYATYADDGGSPILTYALDIDRGDGAGFVEVVDAPGNSETVTTGIASGATYQVRYRASNVHGPSADSAVLEIVAATVPSAPNTVAVANSAGDAASTVNVAWSTPSILGGDGILIASYAVFIRESDGATFSEAPSGTGCNPTGPTD